MPRPPRSPYTPEDRQRALAALYASGEDVDGEWVPNANAVSRVEGMPTTATLLKWWRGRDKAQDSTHLKAAQRAREDARKDGADAYYRRTIDGLKEGVDFILLPRHRDTVGPGLGELGLHSYARALREVGQLTEKLRILTAPLDAPDKDADTLPPEEAAAQTVAILQRNPELLARALSTLPPEARAAVLAAADRDE